VPEAKAQPTKKVATRKAISAEAYGDWNKKEDFKPRVIPKTEDAKVRYARTPITSFVGFGQNLKCHSYLWHSMQKSSR
jgi:hypothetical protein